MNTAGRAVSSPSFDYFVGALQDRLRHREAERLGGLEVDHQLKFGRLLDWQIGWLGAVEDLAGVNAGLAHGSRLARSIADQAAGSGGFTPRIDRWNGMARCQRHEVLAPAEEQWIGEDEARAGMQFAGGCESGGGLAFGAGLPAGKLPPLG